METIQRAVPMIKSVMGNQTYNSETEYRFLTFVAQIEYKGKIILMNTLTRAIIILEPTEYEGVLKGQKDALYQELVAQRFLVPEAHDDFKLSEQVISLAKAFDAKKGTTGYVIFPTMDCNARCFYCFQHGEKRYPMTDKVAADAAEYIIKKSLGQPVELQWFGGEPLYNMKAIDIICNRLKENGTSFVALMISNGYLFDAEVVKKAKELWNIETVQITLDGTEEIYNRCKNYIYKEDKSPFKRVLENILLLAKSGIKVIIRLNMDAYNANDLSTLVGILAEKLADYKELITVYGWLLYDEHGLKKKTRAESERHALTHTLLELEKHIEKYGLASKNFPSPSIKHYACIADRDNYTVILPDGRLGKCDHHSEDELYGSIYSDDIDADVVNSWKQHRERIELCNNCPLVPQCHHIKKCPTDGAYECDEPLREHRLSYLYRQMRNIYDKYAEAKEK